ncbi:hypothetical protein SLEP1_g44563 [Rubroshorea leprosula]|uniref:F-box domain-containing protein n=1 Tax=Rubroshorea leprosula TaxID=152421 RepID=A0AAV5LGJ4_9ROSI|nr:hypothetical protein SLEP1_g44563 [Rubroshorea leprosula]
MDMNTNIGGGGVDTELLECIIHYIMSRLPTKAVARTSVLSKTWYQIWKNYTSLGFSLTQKNKDDVVKSLRQFSQHKISVRSFHVSMGDPDLYSHLDTLITLALENGVQFLRLTLYGIIDCMGFKSVYISNLVQLHTLELYLQDNDVDVDEIVIASQRREMPKFSVAVAPKGGLKFERDEDHRS